MARKLYWGFAIPISLVAIVGVFFMRKKDTCTYKRVVVNDANPRVLVFQVIPVDQLER